MQGLVHGGSTPATAPAPAEPFAGPSAGPSRDGDAELSSPPSDLRKKSFDCKFFLTVSVLTRHVHDPSVIRYLHTLRQSNGESEPRGETGQPCELVQDLERPEPGSSRKIANFSLESLIRFKNDHMEHTADQAPRETVKKRPNYDGRKRKFLAALPLERTKYLNGSSF